MAVIDIGGGHHLAALLDAITSALAEGQTTWLAQDGKRRAVIAPAPSLPATTPWELTYEGEVRFADGTRVSLQCLEGRCEECPDQSTEGDKADGPLDGGYNCECACDHGPASQRGPAAGPPQDDPARTQHAMTPAGLWKTLIVIWSRYPGDQAELSGLARDAETGGAYCSFSRSVPVTDPAADLAWDGTDFFGTRLAGALLICDGCLQAATGQLAECADGCPQDLDHTGLCLRATTAECQWCGDPDRLHEVRRGDVEHLLPTVGEENQGQWFLHWPGRRQGPYPAAQAAWDAWHASGEEPLPAGIPAAG